MSKSVRHFLDINELPLGELRNMLAASAAMKAKLKAQEKVAKPLEGKTLAMIFERPSTRTRVSFDVGMRQLGGEAIMLTGAEMQLGRDETIADTARVLSRYVDAIMIRILNHDALLELAAHATVPVINGLTRRSHPCQVMADLMTFEEHRGPIEGQDRGLDRRRQQRAGVVGACGGTLQVQAQRRDPAAARAEQGDEGLDQGDAGADRARHRSRSRRRAAPIASSPTPGSRWATRTASIATTCSKPYQVNAKLMARADKDAIFMHCLPAHRGEEVTDEVIDGPQSVVFDEAENRLHAQKGILAWCFNEVA